MRASDTTMVALQRIGPVGHCRNVLELVAWDVNGSVRLWYQHVDKTVVVPMQRGKLAASELDTRCIYTLVSGNTIWLADQTAQGARVNMGAGEVLGGFRTAHLAPARPRA